MKTNSRKGCAAPAACAFFMNRRKERETVFQLLFETEFHSDMTPSAVYLNAAAAREIEETPYIHDTYFGVMEKKEEADALISQFSRRWKLSRMAVVTRNLLRLAAYEMTWGGVPPKAAINEALEIAKIYDDDAAPAFINGILNQIAREKGLLADAVQKTDGENAQ
ncbi:MAG: transcription antitermination factor NusB [Ruminococcaceae bacterium]|nr:transcription antitermination factor NusB [Oscillospiraceae bacterium]